MLPGDSKIKIWFMSGGCQKFLNYFIQILKQVRARRQSGPDATFLKHLTSGTLDKHFGYVDPSDPTTVFVTQPVDDYSNKSMESYYAPPLSSQQPSMNTSMNQNNPQQQHYEVNYAPVINSQPVSINPFGDQQQSQNNSNPVTSKVQPSLSTVTQPVPQSTSSYSFPGQGIMLGGNNQPTIDSTSPINPNFNQQQPQYTNSFDQPQPGTMGLIYPTSQNQIQPQPVMSQGYNQPQSINPVSYQQGQGYNQQPIPSYQQGQGYNQQQPQPGTQASSYPILSQPVQSTQVVGSPGVIQPFEIQQPQPQIQQQPPPRPNVGWYFGIPIGPRLNRNN